MVLKVIKKDFLPVDSYLKDKNILKYSFTGRVFESITAFLISDGINNYWGTEEDILEIFPNIDFRKVDDRTNPRNIDFISTVIKIYHNLLTFEDNLDRVISRVVKYTNDKFIIEYMNAYNKVLSNMS